MNTTQKPDYGIDSPHIVGGELIAGALSIVLALVKPTLFGFHVRWIEALFGVYLLHGALSLIEYSRAGKLRLRDWLLNAISWRGDEIVLDVGCGKGLLLVGAARRLTTGKAIGVDLWLPHALTGNGPAAVLRNAELEGVHERVELKKGDVRNLPFDAGMFDVVVSNFVVHEVNTSTERATMLSEMVRVLKPGGRLALIDFIFTKECVDVLQRAGMADVRRSRLGGLRFWLGCFLTFGMCQLYAVTARSRTVTAAASR